MSTIREIIAAATPGPWERGDHWHIQGASHCKCLEHNGPLVFQGEMDINGRMMMAHVHRREKPVIKDGISTAWLDERTHEPWSIVIETDEYGLMSDGDACYIATFDPEHIALMEDVCATARSVDCSGTSDYGERVRRHTDALAVLKAYREKRGLE